MSCESVFAQATIDFNFDLLDGVDDDENIADIEDRIRRAEYYPSNVKSITVNIPSLTRCS